PTRDPSRPPMLAVSLNVDPVLDTREMGFTGLDLSIEVEPRTFENFEWFVNGVIHDDGAIELQVQYNSELFSSEAMAFYFVGFQAFLEQITESPDSPLNSHQMMTVAQRQQVICDWNDTEVTYECAETLQAEFDRTAQEHPNSIAVQFHDQSLTYREVQKRANQLANFLISRDVSQGDLVGICVDRSAEMFISVLAILKAGAGYVPLDPAYPEERLQYMCDHADVKLVVATEQHHELIKRFAKPCVAVDTFESEIAEQDAESPKTSCSKTDIAYVIFTSGSTGQPKGVRVPHQTVLNLLHSMLRQPGLAPHESILAVTSLSFDMSVSEIFLPMTCGACLAIADKETTIDGEKLAAAIAKHDAKLIQATPATWRLLANSSWSGKKDLRIVSAGEPFPADLVAPLLDRTSEVWNMYGPTETTVYSTVERLTDANATILIGDPVANTQIYILDSNGFVVPPGVEGEMFIGGAGVTCGYLNREDLTSERFTQNPWFNPFANFANWKLYKTGDVARRLFDGKIEYLRRNDKQVKIRGFRIELGEVEKCILSLDSAIQQVVAIVRQDSLGSPTLIAYWVAGSETQFAAADLREHLRESLPHYMIPKHFVRLDELPKTSNGKIDHKALPEPELQTQSAGNIIPPATDAEKFLAKVWEEILEMDGISLDDNFFELGGHSLLVMQVIARVEDASGTRLGPQDFLIGTLESLADQIEDSREISTPEPQKVKQAESEPIAEEEEPTQEQKPKTGFGLLRGFWD
ncbi:MAG: amino acid adenylation domain-containing protein, partial [Rubripirellula sp.]